MDCMRSVLDRMCVILLLLGLVSLAGAYTSLLCTNDYDELMSCMFDAHNCTEYSLTLHNDYDTQSCVFSPCDSGCSCTIKMILVSGEVFTANVSKNGQSVELKQISIKDTIKPKTPTIISVTELNGSFQVKWKTNMRRILDTLQAVVTYYKKGTNEMVAEPCPRLMCTDNPHKVTCSKKYKNKRTGDITLRRESCDTLTEDIFGTWTNVTVNPGTINDESVHEIQRRDLEPSTTYVVSVKTYTDLSDRMSDSSKECEFTTPVSPFTVDVAIVLSISVVCIIIAAAAFGCCIKMKTNLWDKAAKCQNPTILDIKPKQPEILTPVLPSINPVSVECFIPDISKIGSKESLTDSSSGSPKSSGISTGSSSFSYANTEPADVITSVKEALMKTFPIFGPVSPVAVSPLPELDSCLPSTSYNPSGVRDCYSSSASSCFDNKTYSITIPQPASTGIQMQAEMLCEPAYHSSEAESPRSPTQHLINLSHNGSPLMPTDMSYQQCNNADSGRFSYATDSSFSSISSNSNTSAACNAKCDNCDDLTTQNVQSEELSGCAVNPCYGDVPADLHSAPQVDYDYQAFNSVVQQPHVVIPEDRGTKNYPEESHLMLPEIMNSNSQGAMGLPESERPFLPFVSADQSMPVIVDSGYQSV